MADLERRRALQQARAAAAAEVQARAAAAAAAVQARAAAAAAAVQARAEAAAAAEMLRRQEQIRAPTRRQQGRAAAAAAQNVDEEDDEEDDEAQIIQQGRAFEVHNINRQFLHVRDSYIRAIIRKVGTSVERIHARRFQEIITSIIERSQMSDDDKNKKIRLLNAVVNRMVSSYRPTAEQLETLSYTIAYVLTLPYEQQLFYADAFINDCATAYGSGPNSLSCGGGSYERIHLILRDTLLSLESENKCDETCKEILSLFSREFSYSEALKNWKNNISRRELSSEILAKHNDNTIVEYGFTEAQLEEQWNDFFNYALDEYRLILQTNLVPPDTVRELQSKQDEFKGMLRDSLLGGRRHKNKERRFGYHNKAKTLRKHHNKAKSGKRKNKKNKHTRKNGQKNDKHKTHSRK
jgi:hypothetical protein